VFIVHSICIGSFTDEDLLLEQGLCSVVYSFSMRYQYRCE